METFNQASFDFFVESINTFINSSQALDVNFLSEIASLIDYTYNCLDNNLRNQKTQELEDLKRSLDWKKYVLSLLQIAYFSQNLSSKNLEDVLHEASNHIFKESAYGFVNAQELMVLVAANLCCLVNKDFPISIRKKPLIRILENLLKIEIDERDQIKDTLDYYSVSALSTATRSQAFGYTLILRQILLENSLCCLEIQKVEFYLHHISQLGINILGDQNLLASISPEDLVYIIEETYCISQICMFLVERSLREVPVEEDATDKYILKDDPVFHQSSLFQATPLYVQILELLEKVLDVNISDTNIKLLSLSSNNEFNVQLNRAKKYAVQTLNLILVTVFNLKKLRGHSFSNDETILVNNFIQKFEGYLKFFLTQLHEVTIGLYSSVNIPTYDQEDVIQDAIILLGDMVVQYEYYTVFLDNRSEIIVNIILNLLLTKKSDYDELKENPKEVVQIEEDIVSKRESDTLKTCAADFLFKFCQKVDGTLSWVTFFLIKTIHMTLGQPGEYSDFIPFQQSLLLAKVDATVRIETSLQAILILTDLIQQRTDLVQHLEKLLRSDFQLLLEIRSNLLKCRLCLFMKEMIALLFKTNESYFTQAVQFLFECLVDFGNQAVSLQALHSLELITKKNQEFERVEGIVFDILKYLEKIVVQAKDVPYFEFLIAFICDYKDKISRYSSVFIKLLTQRVWKEFSELKKEGTNIIIQKSLEGICKIISVKEIIDESFKSFEGDLEYLFTIMDQGRAVQFDEDLLLIATEIAKNISFNTPIYSIVQRNLAKSLRKNDDTIDVFFNLFYYWSTVGNAFITKEKPDLLKDMVEVCLISIESFPIESLTNEYKHFSEACVCLQIIIQCFDKDQLAPLINHILQKLDKMESQICSDEMRAVGFRFFQIYYGLISSYPTETLRHLIGTELLHVLIEKIPHFYLEYFSEDIYSRKVIAVGLISLFYNRTSSCLDENLASACFISLVKILRYIPNEGATKKPAQKASKFEETKASKDSDQDLMDLTSSEVIYPHQVPLTFENNKIVAKIKKLDLPIMKKQEHQLFSKIYNQFKESHAAFNDVMMSILTSEMKESLNIILSAKNYIQGENNTPIIRKQITVKKKPNVPAQGYLPQTFTNSITNEDHGHFSNHQNEMTE